MWILHAYICSNGIFVEMVYLLKCEFCMRIFAPVVYLFKREFCMRKFVQMVYLFKCEFCMRIFVQMVYLFKCEFCMLKCRYSVSPFTFNPLPALPFTNTPDNNQTDGWIQVQTLYHACRVCNLHLHTPCLVICLVSALTLKALMLRCWRFHSENCEYG